jgi:hypothetical protein
LHGATSSVPYQSLLARRAPPKGTGVSSTTFQRRLNKHKLRRLPIWFLSNVTILFHFEPAATASSALGPRRCSPHGDGVLRQLLKIDFHKRYSERIFVFSFYFISHKKYRATGKSIFHRTQLLVLQKRLQIYFSLQDKQGRSRKNASFASV